jgi:hypothetical protein
MSRLTVEKINKLTTPRLIAYQKKQRSFLGQFGCECCGLMTKEEELEFDELTKHTGYILFELLKRDDYNNIKSQGQIKKKSHDNKSKNKGCQSLKKSKKRKLNNK